MPFKPDKLCYFTEESVISLNPYFLFNQIFNYTLKLWPCFSCCYCMSEKSHNRVFVYRRSAFLSLWWYVRDQGLLLYCLLACLLGLAGLEIMVRSKAETITRTSRLVRVVSPRRPQFLKVF